MQHIYIGWMLDGEQNGVPNEMQSMLTKRGMLSPPCYAAFIDPPQLSNHNLAALNTKRPTALSRGYRASPATHPAVSGGGLPPFYNVQTSHQAASLVSGSALAGPRCSKWRLAMVVSIPKPASSSACPGSRVFAQPKTPVLLQNTAPRAKTRNWSQMH